MDWSCVCMIILSYKNQYQKLIFARNLIPAKISICFVLEIFRFRIFYFWEFDFWHCWHLILSLDVFMNSCMIMPYIVISIVLLVPDCCYLMVWLAWQVVFRALLAPYVLFYLVSYLVCDVLFGFLSACLPSGSGGRTSLGVGECQDSVMTRTIGGLDVSLS